MRIEVEEEKKRSLCGVCVSVCVKAGNCSIVIPEGRACNTAMCTVWAGSAGG